MQSEDWMLSSLSQGMVLAWLVKPHDPPRVTQELSAWQPKYPSSHVTSTTIYISTPNHYSYLLRCSGAKSQDRNEVAIIKLHLLAFEIHCLLLLWVSRLYFLLLLLPSRVINNRNVMPELHCPMLHWTAVILQEGQGEISTHGIRTESKPVNLFAFF